MNQQTTPQTAAQTAQPPADGDYLGYNDYADTLWARILAALNKDALAAKDANGEKPLGDDPLVVGIFGEWGAGKSRLLKLIERKAEALAKERVEARQTNISQDLTVPVFFQPWKYEHEAHLLLPLLLHILVDLERILKLAQTPTEGLAQAVHKTGDAVIAFLPQAIYKLKGLLISSKAALAVSDPTGSTAIALGLAGALTAILPKLKKPGSTAAKDFSLEDDGRSYYEIHKILKQITRPQKYEFTHPTIQLKHDIRINFVIFIDDLDRCLPEKAVETLELIKTIFNAESFAFVLALDEEVVERGIGHRYKDYALVGKKPEMPITGFEYLEKIVHLPFRLPALTQAQALGFMTEYETQLIKQRAPNATPRDPWFKEKKLSVSDGLKEKIHNQTDAHTQEFLKPDALVLNLAALVIHSFDAYVPRKLIRVVELFHQVLDVLGQRETHAALQVGGNADSTADPRIVLAHILLQLFQPDLHRTLRRSKTGFDVLLKAFAPAAQGTADKQRQLSERVSDADLLHWAVYGAGDLPPTSLRMAALRVVDKALDEGQRYTSQRLLLLIVERLLEHRAIQRHVFDPLRLFAALQASTQASGVALPDDTRWMYGLLVAKPDTLGLVTEEAQHVLRRVELVVVTGTASTAQSQLSTGIGHVSDGRLEVNVSDIDGVFLTLISPEEPEQRRVAEVAGLQPGQVMTSRNAADLLVACDNRFLKTQASSTLVVDDPERRQRLLRGLKYLAPHIPRSDGERFWDLVKDVLHGGELGEPLADMDQLQARELWADVRSTLGQDPRFDRETLYGAKEEDEESIPGIPLYLPKERSSVWKSQSLNDKQVQGIEPIPGFTRVSYDPTFQLSDASGQSNVDSNIFYIARTLTTVDQYAAFIDDGGYHDDKAALWGGQGRAWLTGAWDDAIRSDEKLKERLAKRPKAERHQPAHWAQQQAHGSRAVWGTNWFEARAYARWLDAKLRQKLDAVAQTAGSGSKRYEVRLPTEVQWERAARSANATNAHPIASKLGDAGYWPWVRDAATAKLPAHLQANIDASKIGRASVVGLFAPNPLAANDLAGNLWEWQDNLYAGLGWRNAWERIEDQKDDSGRPNGDWLPAKGDLLNGKSARPALRGGSWGNSADFARCSSRNWIDPDFWNGSIGFRVVLSLVSLKSET
jgi:formylglycine-generating enzyme required for sulfatase activity